MWTFYLALAKQALTLHQIRQLADKRSWRVLRQKRSCCVRKLAPEVLYLVCYPGAVLYEKERRKKMTKLDFSPRLVHRLPRTLKYVCECVCVLLGSNVLSACLVWGFVASLAVILLVHQYGPIKISLAIPK